MARLAPCLLAAVALAVALMAPSAWGHGMLIDPPNRVSAWRYGFDTPVNYDDEEQFCGGIAVQWEQNGGKCGLCGDSYSLPTPRPSENGGTYGTGTIVKKYQAGQKIQTTTLLTTNHKGGITFHLCPLAQPGDPETEECFDRYPLQLATGGTVYRLPNSQSGLFSVDLVLPAGVTCKQCVLRWTYTAGNNWGVCSNGTGAMGCGPQETYKNCADVTIL